MCSCLALRKVIDLPCESLLSGTYFVNITIRALPNGPSMNQIRFTTCRVGLLVDTHPLVRSGVLQNFIIQPRLERKFGCFLGSSQFVPPWVVLAGKFLVRPFETAFTQKSHSRVSHYPRTLHPANAASDDSRFEGSR